MRTIVPIGRDLNSSAARWILSPLLSACMFASACSPRESIVNLGNGILETVGLSDGATVFKPQDGLKDAATNPSQENEYFLGRAVAAKLLGLFPARHDAELEEYLAYILSVVSAASERPVTFKGYRVVILDTEEVTAMSAPGGFVLISVGMLRRLTSEDEVAAVLAHEVAHIEKRHGLNTLSREKLGGAVDALGVVAGSLYCGQVVQQALAVLNATVNDLVDTLVTKGYSRDQEYEADRRSAAILLRAGYDPSALIGALKSLEHRDSSSSGGWLSTHPSPQSRISEAQMVINQSPDAATRGLRIARFEAAFRGMQGV